MLCNCTEVYFCSYKNLSLCTDISDQIHTDSNATVRNEAEMRSRIFVVGTGESLPVISSTVILLSDSVLILTQHQLKQRNLCERTHKNDNSISCKHCIFLVTLPSSSLVVFQVDLCHCNPQTRTKWWKLVQQNIHTSDFTGTLFFVFPYSFYSTPSLSLK